MNSFWLWLHSVVPNWVDFSSKFIGVAVQAAFAAVISIATGKHGLAFMAFTFLVAADWLSKRYAVCRRYVSDTCGIPLEEVDIRSALKAWNQARGEKYWQSEKMRKRSSKLVTYIVGVGIASAVDILTGHVAGKEIFTNLVLCYFGLTEAESILENLKEAGIGKAAEVCKVIEKKKNQYLGISAKKESEK